MANHTPKPSISSVVTRDTLLREVVHIDRALRERCTKVVLAHVLKEYGEDKKPNEMQESAANGFNLLSHIFVSTTEAIQMERNSNIYHHQGAMEEGRKMDG